MSEREENVPPVGEEIHLPGGSFQPILMTIGITVALLGLTTSWALVVGGVVLMVATGWVWVNDARREIDELPAEHH